MLTTQITFNPQNLDETKRAIELYEQQKHNFNVTSLKPSSNLIDLECLQELTINYFEYHGTHGFEKVEF